MTNRLYKDTDELYLYQYQICKIHIWKGCFTYSSKLTLCVCHRCYVATRSSLVPSTTEQPLWNLMFQKFKEKKCSPWTFIPCPHFNHWDTCMYLFHLICSSSLSNMKKKIRFWWDEVKGRGDLTIGILSTVSGNADRAVATNSDVLTESIIDEFLPGPAHSGVHPPFRFHWALTTTLWDR